MRVVVTGGAGFIGGNLCRRLLATDVVSDVVVLDDLSTGNVTNIESLPVTFVEGSITDDAALDKACAGAAAIVHLGALGSVPRSVADPIASHHANATGTLMVLEAARRHGNLHTIVASSSSVYGSNPVLPKHEDLACRPMSPYAATKLVTEGYALAYGNAYSLPVLAFRFFNVFGPLQPAGHAYAAVVPAFVDAALSGVPLTVHGDGTQTRCFAHVRDVVRALLLLLDDDRAVGGTFNVGSSDEVSILELAKLIVELAESTSGVDLVPYTEAYGKGFEDMTRRVPDTGRLRALTGWTPALSLDDILLETIADARAELAAPGR